MATAQSNNCNAPLKEAARVISRLSEEAIVVLAVLATFAYSQYLKASQTLTFVILLAALGCYVSLRIISTLGRN
jgi:hypothetical protein